MPNKTPEPLYMFHTGQAHVNNFNALGEEFAKHIPLNHMVREDILADAIKLGYVSDKNKTVIFKIWHEMAKNASVLMNTCSTLGALADEFNQHSKIPMLRIDRPMAELAAKNSGNIAVCTGIMCTLFSSHDLVYKLAHHHNPNAHVTGYVATSAFKHYLAGDFKRYEQEILLLLRHAATNANTLVLATASMAPAAKHLSDELNIYTSPKSGFLAAKAVW